MYRNELFPTGNHEARRQVDQHGHRIDRKNRRPAPNRVVARRRHLFAQVMGMLGLYQILVAAIVVLGYPETAHLELETLNPEDAPIDLPNFRPDQATNRPPPD